MTSKNPAAVSLGRRGGKAGTGESKKRGDSAYYQRIGNLALQARQKKARAKK